MSRRQHRHVDYVRTALWHYEEIGFINSSSVFLWASGTLNCICSCKPLKITCRIKKKAVVMLLLLSHKRPFYPDPRHFPLTTWSNQSKGCFHRHLVCKQTLPNGAKLRIWLAWPNSTYGNVAQTSFPGHWKQEALGFHEDHISVGLSLICFPGLEATIKMAFYFLSNKVSVPIFCRVGEWSHFFQTV